MWARLLLLFLGALFAAPVAAHEVRPAYLQIREAAPATYDISWKTPARGDLRLALGVVLPAECENLSAPRLTHLDAAVIERWRTACAGGLTGKEIEIANLASSLTDVILRFEPAESAAKTFRMTGAAPSVIIPARQPYAEVAIDYARLGVEHILLGFDHLLFVLCLVLLVKGARRLIGVVSAFTLAHAITLAAATLGWARAASAPVEALIALSIVFVAAEIVRARSGAPGLTQRWPWIAAFGFGLLHGFGFAGALSEIGLPEGAVPLALLFFNLGVEAGQVAFVIALLVLLRGLNMLAPHQAALTRRTAPYVAGAIAAFWFIERTVAIVV